jgi:hypothetical protein
LLIPSVSTSTGAAVVDAEAIRRDISRAMTGQIRWSDMVTSLRELGVTTLIEIVPGRVSDPRPVDRSAEPLVPNRMVPQLARRDHFRAAFPRRRH